ncbi:MAG: hypothetical protein RL094_276 [Candidatus Parcubacteria bacterium]|jgi:hypothetical protein
MVANFKEIVLNALGLALINIEMDAELSDSIMDKTEKWFWAITLFVFLGTISYLI